MLMRRLLFLLAVCALPGCGAADVGEECDEAGETDECEDGAVCTNEGDGAVCRALCKEQEDCASGESCNGVSDTNLKSCQPDE
jgi:hypothetical protein